MLGVYDYTVVLTYVSLMVSIGGMMFAVNGHLHLGVMCLAISGLCDMFDGKIARTKKNRTEVEKRFGIQIDSLSDIVCFGVAPAVLCYCFGMRGVIGCGNPDVLCTCRSDPSCVVQCDGRTASGRNSREKRMLSGAPNHIHGNRTSACGCIKTIFRL